MMRALVVVLLGGLLVPVAARAQAPAAEDLLRQLLTEVRALRTAMERSATVGARIQLLVARVQLQEQRIADLSRRAADVRDDMARVDEGMVAMTGEIKRLESYLERGVSTDDRPQIERQLEMLKSQLAMPEKRRQDLQNEEAQLAQQLSADQGRWAEVNSQLDEPERSLSPVKK